MSDRLYRNLSLLKLLFKAKPAQRRVILQTASNELILTLCEIAFNVLNGTIPLTTKQYRSLKKKKSEITFFADKKVAVSRKKKVINQKGGGILLPLLSVALPFITSLITK